MAILHFPGEAELTRFFENKPARAESVLFHRRGHQGETLESEFAREAGTIRFILYSTVEQRAQAEIYLKQVQGVTIVKQEGYTYVAISVDPATQIAGFVPNVYFRLGAP